MSAEKQTTEKTLVDFRRVFEEGDEHIRSDILLIIIEHLHKEKLFNAANVLEDEVSSKLGGINAKRVKVIKFHKAILNGDWDNSVKLLSTLVPKSSQRCFLYYILRQQYLELIDNGEQERAFPFLVKHLKPLEDIAVTQGTLTEVSEFKELCYLLSCSAIGEAEGDFFREWKHYYHQRELLADQLVGALHKHMQEDGGVLSYALLPTAAAAGTKGTRNVSTNNRNSRLSDLLKQGFAYQIEKSLSDSNALDDLNHGVNCTEEVSDNNMNNPSNDMLPVEYPCVRRVLGDFVPLVHPSRPLAVLTTFPPHKRDGQSTDDMKCEALTEEKRKIQDNIEKDSTISSLVFTSHHQRSEFNFSSIVAVGGGNAGLLYGWELDTGNEGNLSLRHPVWSICLDQSTSRKHNAHEPMHNHDLHRHNKKIRDICCSSGGGIMGVSCSDGSVTLLSRGKNEALSLSSLGRDENVDDDNYVRGYDICGQLNAHDSDAYALALYPSGEYILSGGFDRHVAVTDVQTLQTLKMFYGHTGAVTQVGCNRSGNLVFSSSRDGCVMFWDLLSGVSVRCLTPYAHSSVAALRSGHTPLQPILPTLTPYSTGRGYSQTFRPSSVRSSSMTSAAFPTQDNYTSGHAAVSSSVVPGGGGSSHTGSVSNTSSVATFGDSHSSTISSSGSSAASTGGSEVTSCSLSEDGKYLLVSSRFLPAKLIDLRTGNILVKYKNPVAKSSNGYGSTSMFYRPSFCSKDQSVLGGSSPGHVALWSTHSGALLQSLTIPPKSYCYSNTPFTSESTRSLQACDFSRSVYDRYTGMTGSISNAGVVLWS